MTRSAPLHRRFSTRTSPGAGVRAGVLYFFQLETLQLETLQIGTTRISSGG